MSQNAIQTSFASGELAPSIYAHTDMAKYHAGAATMRNFFVDYRSGASTRTGTKFIIQARDSASSIAPRLVSFQFSATSSYIIEFGERYCRFIQDGGTVLETSYAIGGVSNSNPGVVNVPGNPFVAGDWVFIYGTGVAQLDNRYFAPIVAGPDLILRDVNGVLVDTSNYTPWVAGGFAARVYLINSPYSLGDLATLKFIQSGSTLTITHPGYVPYNLISAGPTTWSFVAITIGSSAAAPTGAVAVAGTAGTTNYAYVVTSVDSSGQESLVSNVANLPLSADLTAVAATNTITWTAAAGADHYNVYKAEASFVGAVPAGAAFGFIGNATGLTLVDSNIPPDFSISPPISRNPFAAGVSPSCASYYQQRLTFAGPATVPTRFNMSQPGAFYNFNVSNPIQEDDAIQGTIVSLEVNAIKSLVPMPGGLIALTAKGAWQIAAGGGGVAATAPITPINATATPQAYNGASELQPLVVNTDIIYVQSKGSIVRDLSYNIYANIYTGTDISVLSNHLFFSYTIPQWAYAEEPFKIIWAIRNDGILLSLTYMKEQEIYGWARHDTLGLFKSVASVTEGTVDAVYVIVQRQIGANLVYMIERMADRSFTYSDQNPNAINTLPVPYLAANAESAWCVDCGYQTILTKPGTRLRASANTGTVSFDADVAVFSSGNVGSVIRMGGGIATIVTYNSGTNVLGTWTASPSVTIANDPLKTPAPAAAGTWSIAAPITTIYGLAYLEGQTVSILADGGVVNPQVVVNGTITLANPASLVTVGLGFQARLQTMNFDLPGGETVQAKRKKLAASTIRGVNSRGLKVGPTFNANALVPIKELNRNVPLGSPIPLVSGDERIVMTPYWSTEGQVCIQQDDPLPATVLGVINEYIVGDTSGSGRNP